MWTTDKAKAKTIYFNNAGNMYQIKDKATGYIMAFTYSGSVLGLTVTDGTGAIVSSTTETVQNGKLIVAKATSKSATMPVPLSTRLTSRTAKSRSLDPDDNPPDGDSDDQVVDNFSGDPAAYINAEVQFLATWAPAAIGQATISIGKTALVIGIGLAAAAILIDLPVIAAAESALLIGTAMYAGGTHLSSTR